MHGDVNARFEESEASDMAKMWESHPCDDALFSWPTEVEVNHKCMKENIQRTLFVDPLAGGTGVTSCSTFFLRFREGTGFLIAFSGGSIPLETALSD